ncbi:polymorphic toxin-type HINT domain-containing protein, partial [Micromonospora tulbaghiae]
AKALAKILMDELGITDALDCFLKGDMGGCLATAVNVAGAAIGGALGKLAVRYGAPWKWKKLANLTSRVKGLLGDLVDGAKSFFKKGCHSFAPGTLVLLSDGSLRPIEEVGLGDEVQAYNPETGQDGAFAVVATFRNTDFDLVDLTLIGGDGGRFVVETTQNHPFWSQDRLSWVDAGDLRPGEELLTRGGENVRVESTRLYMSQRQMYDLTVDGAHTYFVVPGGTPVLVHNNNGPFSCEVTISRSTHPESAQHIEDAQAAGHPDILTINRPGAKQNRADSLRGHKKVPGKQLDEYPPAMFEEGGTGASVRAIDGPDNGGAGARIGNSLRRYPDGTRVKISVVD